MKKTILIIFVLCLLITNGLTQTFTEKEIYKNTYKGKLDANNFIYDKASGTFCYLYSIENENKFFIISNNTVSGKYDYFNFHETCFDSKGNYYSVSTDYKKDYGSDNYFLVVNGKTILDFNYIDGYSSYLNNNNEFVFIFKQFEEFKLGYYSIENGFRSTDGYKVIEPIYYINKFGYEEEPPIIFLKNEDGERGFVANKGENPIFIFGDKKIPTTCSDINQWSVTFDKYNQLSYIASKKGKLHKSDSEDIIVVGDKEYKDNAELQFSYPPILFNNNNEPVYSAATQIDESLGDNYLVVGNEIQKAYMDKEKTEPAPMFTGSVFFFSIEKDNTIKYLASEIVSDDGKINREHNNTITYLVDDNVAKKLGNNVGKVKFNPSGDILFSAIDDNSKEKYSLFRISGNNKYKINDREFDGIIEYGFFSSGEVYYIGLNYMVHKLNDSSGYLVYFGDKYLGNYVNISSQDNEHSYEYVKFGSDGSYAFVANEILDTAKLELAAFVVTDKGKLPFVSIIETDKKGYSNISNLMFIKENRLFFTGMFNHGDAYDIEVSIDNNPIGKIYKSISDVEYNEEKNELTFYGVRNDKIYYVTIQF